jgi:hypothetical protein
MEYTAQAIGESDYFLICTGTFFLSDVLVASIILIG